jgi:hypothetical protein
MIGKQSLLSAALSAILIVPLGGCFLTSDPKVPLLTTEAADFPFAKLVIEQKGGPRETYVREGGAYVEANVKPEQRVSEDTFVVQLTYENPPFPGWPKIAYAIARYRPNANEIDALYCGNYSQAIIESLGIQVLKAPLSIKLCGFTSLASSSPSAQSRRTVNK